MTNLYASEALIQLSGHPMDLGWIPHERDTWTHRFAKLKEDVTMEYYAGYWENNNPKMNKVEVKKNTLVKIVMVSRFGDVGITEQLDKEYGYGARVNLDELYDYQKLPEALLKAGEIVKQQKEKL